MHYFAVGHGAFVHNTQIKVPNGLMVIVYAPFGATLSQGAADLIAKTYLGLNGTKTTVQNSDFKMVSSKALAGSTFMAPLQNMPPQPLPSNYPVALTFNSAPIPDWVLTPDDDTRQGLYGGPFIRALPNSQRMLSTIMHDVLQMNGGKAAVLHLCACSAPNLRNVHIYDSTCFMVTTS